MPVIHIIEYEEMCIRDRDIPFFREVRPLEDDEVDRAGVEVQQCMELTVTNRSRA